MSLYSYATRDVGKLEDAKAELSRQAAARKQTIIGWRTYLSTSHPALQQGETEGVEHLIVEGYTTQAEVNALPEPEPIEV